MAGVPHHVAGTQLGSWHSGSCVSVGGGRKAGAPTLSWEGSASAWQAQDTLRLGLGPHSSFPSFSKPRLGMWGSWAPRVGGVFPSSRGGPSPGVP